MADYIIVQMDEIDPVECPGEMELDGLWVPVKPLTAVFIKPGCRHRAVGRMRVINVPIPAFDPADEWFDE